MKTVFCMILCLAQICCTARSTANKEIEKMKKGIFFWLPAARVHTCPGRFALQSATTTRKGQFHVREKQQNHSQSLARTMNELIKQIRKQINPPRKSASETRDPFRSRVINGAHEKRIGAEKPLGSRYL